MTAPCKDCLVICAAGNNDMSCAACEEKWEKDKIERKLPYIIDYWKRREKQPTGQINMWKD